MATLTNVFLHLILCPFQLHISKNCCTFAGGNRIARWNYPAICRTTTMDPLAEKYYATSPYAWCRNNPVNIVDHDGKKIVVGTWYGRMFAKLGVNNFAYKVQQDLDNLKTLSKR